MAGVFLLIYPSSSSLKKGEGVIAFSILQYKRVNQRFIEIIKWGGGGNSFLDSTI